MNEQTLTFLFFTSCIACNLTTIIQLNIFTNGGSITKETTVLEDVDPSWTVLCVKLFIQGKDSVPPQQRDTPPSTVQATTSTDGGNKRPQPHIDFARMFCNGKELVEDEKKLEEYGVEDDSCIRFAVPSSLAADLRTVVSTLIEKYPEDDIFTDASASDDQTRDDMILAFVMDLYLTSYLRVRDAADRRREARSRGEKVEFPVRNKNLLTPDAMQKELYKIFDPTVLPVRFRLLSGGGVDGKTEYMGFTIEANKTNYRYKTCYGIPVKLLSSNRIKQSALQAGPERQNLAAPGFVTQDRKKMACAQHWALAVIVGCEVKTKFGTGTVRTIRENEGVAVVDFDWGGVGYLDLKKVERLQLRPVDPETPIYISNLPNHSRGQRIGSLTTVSGYDDAVVDMNRFHTLPPTHCPLTADSPGVGESIVLPATFQTTWIDGQVLDKSPNTNRMLVRRVSGGTPKFGDSNAVWVNEARNHTIGIHCSYDHDDQTMTVLRIKNNRADLEVNQEEVRRSGRKRGTDTVSRELFPSDKRQRTL